jgi:hypothetical protein
MSQGDGHAVIVITMPGGAQFTIRRDAAGIVYGEDGEAVDDELAAQMVLAKMWKLSIAKPAGRA